jgi:hypothetical protein
VPRSLPRPDLHFDRLALWEAGQQLVATGIMVLGMNWVLIWWISWFGHPARSVVPPPIQARELAPDRVSQVVRSAIRQVMRRQQAGPPRPGMPPRNLVARSAFPS